MYKDGVNLSLLSKKELFQLGMTICKEFLTKNNLALATVIAKAYGVEEENRGIYNPHSKMIYVNFTKCKPPIKNSSYSWSYPGYKADITTMGVLAHETGHHVDNLTGIRKLIPTTHPVSGYEPNKMEVVAETMRLFILNPDLLRLVSNARYDFLMERFTPVITQTWEEVLVDAPAKVINNINKNFVK